MASPRSRQRFTPHWSTRDRPLPNLTYYFRLPKHWHHPHHDPSMARTPNRGGRRRGPTEAMVEDLLQHDHCLEIALIDADRYEQLVRAGTRFKKVPDGIRVRVERCWPERTARGSSWKRCRAG